MRVSRSPQQQHHRQQQHEDPLHPAIFLPYSRSGPRASPLPPGIRASRDWPREHHVALSSLGTETGSGCGGWSEDSRHVTVERASIQTSERGRAGGVASASPRRGFHLP